MKEHWRMKEGFEHTQFTCLCSLGTGELRQSQNLESHEYKEDIKITITTSNNDNCSPLSLTHFKSEILSKTLTTRENLLQIKLAQIYWKMCLKYISIKSHFFLPF